MKVEQNSPLEDLGEAFSHLSWILFHLWVSYFDMEIKFTVQFALNQIPCQLQLKAFQLTQTSLQMCIALETSSMLSSNPRGSIYLRPENTQSLQSPGEKGSWMTKLWVYDSWVSFAFPLLQFATNKMWPEGGRWETDRVSVWENIQSSPEDRSTSEASVHKPSEPHTSFISISFRYGRPPPGFICTGRQSGMKRCLGPSMLPPDITNCFYLE